MSHSCLAMILHLFGVKIDKHIHFKGIPIIFRVRGAQIAIGENTTIKSSFLSNLVGLYSRTIIIARTPDAEIRIGNNVGISGATIYARTRVTIGEGTLIGGNVKILDNDFHPIAVEDRIANSQSAIGTKPISIGKNCFIGVNAIILKGTRLGDGCVVGAGAVVSGTFEDNSVIVGNPGRVIKKVK